ncbi:hypothetical protein G6F40_014375 [Rhizopus arrhizus]|nr:hypothetical protein G6F40_014375 [Rhizopus arrhizus]
MHARQDFPGAQQDHQQQRLRQPDVAFAGAVAAQVVQVLGAGCGNGAQRDGIGDGRIHGATLHGDVQLVPERFEIGVEFRPRARLEGRRPGAVARVDAVLALQPAGPARQHDDAVRHGDGLADVVRDQHHRLAQLIGRAAQGAHHGHRMLHVQAVQGFVQQHVARVLA